MGKMTTKEMEQIYKGCDTFVMCSTLNQIVNYIPIMNMLECKAQSDNNSRKVKLVNLTYEGELRGSLESKSGDASEETGIRFDNKGWDENLRNVLREEFVRRSEENEDLSEFIEQNEEGDEGHEFIFDVELAREYYQDDYEEKICDCIKNRESVVWNITGGQRNILLTVLDLIREDIGKEQLGKHHTILYMEGNTNRWIVGTITSNSSKIEKRELEELYQVKDLSIQKVLGLAGFNVSGEYKPISIEQLINDIEKKQKVRRDAYEKFWEIYKKDLTLRENCLRVQSKKEQDKVYDWNSLISDLEKKDRLNKEELEVFKGIQGEDTSKFGYVLEELLFFRILEAIKKLRKSDEWKDYFIELRHNISPKDEGTYCQFDVVLLARTGQPIIFECKSSAISSDTAKARMYTSYAVSGVYGTPILVPPFLNEDYDEIKKALIQEKTIWSKMKSLYNAAKISGIRLWHLDEIEENIKTLYNEILRNSED